MNNKEAKIEYQFPGKGTVFSFTTVYDAPAGFVEFAPYKVALVRLEVEGDEPGPLITAQLTDLDPNVPVEIGMPVEMVTRVLKREGDTGLIIYGYKFRPVGLK